MSRAFTRDGDEHALPVVPERAPLPEGVPNYVTPRGLQLLRDEMAGLESERKVAASEGSREDVGALDVRREQLARRIATAVVVDTVGKHGDEVRFGAVVRVLGREGERSYAIVGVDEAEPSRGLVAFTSPVARALLGKEPGDVALVDTPGGRERVEILDVAYG